MSEKNALAVSVGVLRALAIPQIAKVVTTRKRSVPVPVIEAVSE
jgi:hypothetical protein